MGAKVNDRLICRQVRAPMRSAGTEGRGQFPGEDSFTGGGGGIIIIGNNVGSISMGVLVNYISFAVLQKKKCKKKLHKNGQKWFNP